MLCGAHTIPYQDTMEIFSGKGHCSKTNEYNMVYYPQALYIISVYLVRGAQNSDKGIVWFTIYFRLTLMNKPYMRLLLLPLWKAIWNLIVITTHKKQLYRVDF